MKKTSGETSVWYAVERKSWRLAIFGVTAIVSLKVRLPKRRRMSAWIYGGLFFSHYSDVPNNFQSVIENDGEEIVLCLVFSLLKGFCSEYPCTIFGLWEDICMINS